MEPLCPQAIHKNVGGTLVKAGERNIRLLMVDFAGHPFQAELSRALARMGLEVRHAHAGHLTGPKGAISRDSGDPESLSFVSLGSGRLWRSFLIGRLMVGLGFGRALAHEIRRFRPDVVIASNVPPEGLFMAGFGRPPLCWIWWVQDLLAPGATRTLRRRSRVLAWVAGNLFGWLEAGVARRADSVVLISEAFKRHIPPASQSKVVVIHNWAPLDELPLVPKSNAWAVEAGLASTFNLVYTGTLGMKHNPQMLVELAEGLRSSSGVRVVVVSEGPGADSVRREADARGLEQLTVIPFQPYARLPEVMGTADILLALLNEDAGLFSVPSKILSYLCAGRPVLASMPRENLASRLLLDAGAGVIVSPGASEAFVAQALALMAAAPSKRAAMGAAGRTFAEKNFRIDTIADRFSSLWET